MNSVSENHVFTSEKGLRTGVVIRVDRATAVVEDPAATAEPVRATWGASLLAAIAENPEAAPTTGDRVGLRFWPDERVTVDVVQPRRTLLTRGDADGGSKRQLLAANIDTVAVVESFVPDPDLHRISRFLTLAWASGAEPVILLTKSDLVPDGREQAAELQVSTACPVIEVSAVSGAGVAQVRELLAGERTMALLGASGAGKSSLVNALAGGPLMRVQEVRKDGKGRHTTVTRELHRIAGGYLIDGPGLRSVGLTGGEGLDLTFADVLEVAERCRFSDCEHESEPGCAVLAAIATGELDPDRVQAWRDLSAEGYRQSLRRDARLRAEESRKRKVIHKAARRLYRERPHRGGF